jgi:ribosomal protein S14
MISRLATIKDFQLRNKNKKHYKSFLYLKSNVSNFFFKKKVAYYFFRFFYLLYFYTKIKNFCVLSYRRRGVFNFFKLTRMMFKQFALNKQLVGIIKSSW